MAGEMTDEELEDEEEEVELLFLIEFLVDTFMICMKNLDLGNYDPCQLQGQTCLQLDFLHFPSMNICEKDLDPERITGCDDIKYNLGKSLMFALSNKQFKDPPPIYLNVTGLKQLPHGSDPPSLIFGYGKVCLSDLFQAVFNKIEDCPECLPYSKSMKNSYQLMTERNKLAGELVLYVRLTCMGQNIVTEFQRGDQCDPYLFKSRESEKVYQCKPKDLGDKSEDNLCPNCPGYGESGFGGGRGGGAGCGDECDSMEKKSSFKDVDFEEFSCEVNGHCMTVRVQKSERARKKTRAMKNLAAGIPAPQAVNPDDFCDCDIPLPDEVPFDTPSKLELKPNCPPTKNGNQVVFQIPPGDNMCKKGDHNTLVYNVNTCDDGPDHGHEGKCKLSIIAGDEAKGKRPFDKDSFVLRIGKKGAANGRGKIELELKAPKDKVCPPPNLPYMIDVEVQTEKDAKKKKKK